MRLGSTWTQKNGQIDKNDDRTNNAVPGPLPQRCCQSMPAYVLRRVYPTGFKEHVVIAAAEIQSSRRIDALKPDESPMRGNTRAGRMHTSWSDCFQTTLGDTHYSARQEYVAVFRNITEAGINRVDHGGVASQCVAGRCRALQGMGCGSSASAQQHSHVAEPQMMAPGPNQAPAGPLAAGCPSSQPNCASFTSRKANDVSSPNSAAKLSGAATPILGSSWSLLEGAEEGDTLVGDGKLLQFQPSLQDRVNLLENFVQTQNFGKTFTAGTVGADNDSNAASEDMDALYDLPQADSALDASWRNKIFSYDGTNTPDALLSEIMKDTRWAKEVQIKACKVDSAGLKFLDQVVQEREIRALTLARCNLEDGVATQVAICLGGEQWSSLRIVGLDGNVMLGDAAAEALAQALMTNTSLEGLFLCLCICVLCWSVQPVPKRRKRRSQKYLCLRGARQASGAAARHLQSARVRNYYCFLSPF